MPPDPDTPDHARPDPASPDPVPDPVPDPETVRAALAALAWQIELGADEAIGDAPVPRFDLAEPEAPPAAHRPAGPPGSAPAPPRAAPRPARPPAAAPGALPAAPAADAAAARAAAAEATSLADLARALEAFDAGPLKAAARSFVFADGIAGAPLMVIGEAPGEEEDRHGRPFVGRAGRLLDRMLSAIGLARDADAPERAVYIANILPWRPPGNRTPTDAEIALFLPFAERHIALARPRAVLALGNTPLRALLGATGGITRARGRWTVHAPTGVPVMPSFHPAYLLRQPAAKKQSWADLLAIAAALEGEAEG